MAPGKQTKGSALVELALIFPLFATLLIGIIDLGQFLFLQQALVERARSSARWGAVTDPSDSVAIANMVLYGQAEAPGPGMEPSFGLQPDMVQVSELDPATDTHRVVVTISGYSFRLLSPLIAGEHAGRPIQVAVPLGP